MTPAPSEARPLPSLDDLIPLGTKTPWGKVVSIALLSGERYYFMVRGNDVAMMPADVVEDWDGK